MVTHRRYFFEHPGPWDVEGSWEKVKALLDYQCESRYWYNEPEVEGQPFGRLAFSFNVTADDQWACHRRAMGLASACYRKLGLPRTAIPVPLWAPLEHPSKTRLLRARQRAQEDIDNLAADIHKMGT